MRKKMSNNAKLIIEVSSARGTNEITTVSVYDNRSKEYWPDERIKERGIVHFINMDDLKESLNWNLNGDSSKFQFQWVNNGRDSSTGKAYVFD